MDIDSDNNIESYRDSKTWLTVSHKGMQLECNQKLVSVLAQIPSIDQ